MAVSAQAELDRIARWIQRDATLGDAAFTKPQLIAAVAAADQWASDNAAAYNTALPAAFRTGANSGTAAQKALLLVYVICRRNGMTGIHDGGD